MRVESEVLQHGKHTTSCRDVFFAAAAKNTSRQRNAIATETGFTRETSD